MLQTMGMFNKIIESSVKMYYLSEFDYQFNSDKFEKTFKVEPTAYRQGIKDLSEYYQKN